MLPNLDTVPKTILFISKCYVPKVHIESFDKGDHVSEMSATQTYCLSPPPTLLCIVGFQNRCVVPASLGTCTVDCARQSPGGLGAVGWLDGDYLSPVSSYRDFSGKADGVMCMLLYRLPNVSVLIQEFLFSKCNKQYLTIVDVRSLLYLLCNMRPYLNRNFTHYLKIAAPNTVFGGFKKKKRYFGAYGAQRCLPAANSSFPLLDSQCHHSGFRIGL